MASVLLAGAGLLAAGTMARASLRAAAKNGAKLSPLMAAIAGQRAAADNWVKGGFQTKMDRKEAAEILGIK